MSEHRTLVEGDLDHAEWDEHGDTPAGGKSLWICTTPRSGSWLLARRLLAAGVGVPHEYLSNERIRRIGARAGTDSTSAYLAWVMTNRRTSNGVYAAKLLWGQLTQHWQATTSVMTPRDTYVHLSRHDIVAQSISLYLARASGEWTGHGSREADWDVARWTEELLSARTPAEHSWTLQIIVEDLLIQDVQWRMFFTRRGIEPLPVVYEDFVGTQAEVVTRIAAQLEVSPARSGSEESRPERLLALDDLRDQLRRMHRAEFGGNPVDSLNAYTDHGRRPRRLLMEWERRGGVGALAEAARRALQTVRP